MQYYGDEVRTKVSGRTVDKVAIKRGSTILVLCMYEPVFRHQTVPSTVMESPLSAPY